MNFKKTHPKAVTPAYATKGSAAFDFTATTKEETDYYIEYGTGISLEIPEGYVGLLFPRSSVTNMDITLKNCVGVIDSDYRGEIKFRFQYATAYTDEIATALSKAVLRHLKGEGEEKTTGYFMQRAGKIVSSLKEYEVGDRIGQMVILPIMQVAFTEVEELEETERGTGGYGSTGK